MTIIESVGIALFLMAVVFAVLICMYLFIKVFSFAASGILAPAPKESDTADKAEN